MKNQEDSSNQPKKTQDRYLENALALGFQYCQIGNLPAAKTIYQQILQSYPDHPQALYSLGAISCGLEDGEAAIQYFTRVAQLNPKSIEAHFNLGVLYQTQGKLELAVSSYQDILALNPNNSHAHYNLAEVLALQGNSTAALKSYLQSLMCPNNLLLQGNYVVARKAVDYCVQFGNEQQKLTSAVLGLNVYLNLGLQKTAYENFLKIEPQLLQNPERFTRLEIAIFYQELFHLPYLRDSVEANSNLCKVIGQLFQKQYLRENTRFPSRDYGLRSKEAETTWVTLQRGGSDSQSSRILNCFTTKNSQKTQPLRIGLISRNFRRHSVGWCSLDVITELSKLTPNLYIYYTHEFHKDDLTEEFQKITPNFYMWSKEYPNTLFNDSLLLERLIFDQLDVILDLDSLMSVGHALILCHHPAPICVSWLGCEAPFVSADNYYLGDWNTHPAGVELHYQEKLLRMPNAHMAISGFNAELSDRETLRKKLQLADHQIVYFCVATPKKLNADLIKTQVSILQQVPDSILLYKGAVGDIETIKAMYIQECEVQGVGGDRLRFLNPTPTEESHRSIYQAVDIILDTYPYNGGTHNLETLWFNVPLVTRVGEQGPSRLGYSFLKALGIEEGIAHNWEEYISWGVRLGLDASLRENIRTRLLQSKQPENLSPLWNPKQFAIDMYLLLEELAVKGRGGAG